MVKDLAFSYKDYILQTANNDFNRAIKMNKTFKIKKFFLIVFLIFIISITFIISYMFWPKFEYGVNIKESDIILTPYYSSQLSENYDFHTVLFLKDGYEKRSSMAVDQAYSLIYINHLMLSEPHPNDDAAVAEGNLRLSSLHFGNHPASTEDLRNIKIKSISLRHFDEERKEIKPFIDGSMSNFMECMSGKRIECIYQRAYKDKGLPNKIIEEIDIQFSYNDKHHHVQKTFIIEKKPYNNRIGRIISAMMYI